MTTALVLVAAIAAAGDGLAFAGDAFLAFDHPTERIAGALVVNHEGSVCEPAGGTLRRGRWRLCARADAAATLAALGVTAASLVNNHADDGDKKALAVSLHRARIAPLVVDRAWCASDAEPPAADERRLCVVVWNDARADLHAVLARVRELRSTGAQVAAYVHLTDGSRAALEKFAKAGASVVFGVGGHEARRARAFAGALIFEDLGDLVVDCRCSRGRHGLVVEVPFDEAAAVRVRVVTVAHDPGDPIGAPADGRELARLLGQSRGVRGLVVDGALELQRPERQQAP
jgi:hypothetical protein